MTRHGQTYKETILYNFKGTTDGSLPQAGLVSDANGVLYGTTSFAGGPTYSGTVYAMTPKRGGEYSYSVLYTFQGGADGTAPYAPVTLDSSGAIYGTTSGYPEGKSGYGTVFKLTPTGLGYAESVLYQFAGGADGAYPVTPVIVGSNGTVYGTAQYGGSDRCKYRFLTGCGTVFAITQ